MAFDHNKYQTSAGPPVNRGALLEEFMHKTGHPEGLTSGGFPSHLTTTSGPTMTNTGITMGPTTKELLNHQIERARETIATMEWFIAHLGLDAPASGTRVYEIIEAGLQILNSRK